MDHQIYSKNVIITDSLKEYLNMRLANFDKFHYKIVSCRVDISRDSHHRKGDIFRVEINLNIPGKLLRLVQTHNDIRAGIDLASEKLLRRLRKYIQKKRDKSRKLLNFLRRKN